MARWLKACLRASELVDLRWDRRYYIDDHLARCRHGIWQVAVFQDFRTTEVFNESRFQ